MSDEWIKEKIIECLKDDRELGFKEERGYLRYGTCPACHKDEVYISLANPWRLACSRENECAWSQNTRDRYSHIFEELKQRAINDRSNPKAHADFYLTNVRGFKLQDIDGYYTQSAKKLDDGSYGATVRVDLPMVAPDAFWERLIEDADIEKNKGDGTKGAKTRIWRSTRGKGWMPPGQTFEEGDEVWITEAIFKCWALEAAFGVKTMTGLTSSNIPWDVIEEHKGKGIVWVIAMDADKAGHKAAEKFRHKLDKMNERCLVAFPEHEGEDWDDAYKEGRLTEYYLRKSLFRGWLAGASSAYEKAMYYYLDNPSLQHHIFEHENSLWRFRIDGSPNQALTQVLKDLNWRNPEGFDGAASGFHDIADIVTICDGYPELLYRERNELTREQWFTMRLTRRFSELIQIKGEVIENPAAFSRALLNASTVGFEGDKSDLRLLRRLWLPDDVKTVQLITYVGYNEKHDVYVYSECGYRHGQRYELNSDGYLDMGDIQIKTGLQQTIRMEIGTEFDGSWIRDYYTAFDLNGMVLLCWWVGTLFAEQIRGKKGKQKSWPFLEYTGEQGAGKSAQIQFLWKCCGRDYEGMDPNKSTKRGVLRWLEQMSNLPAVLLEGDHSNIFSPDILKNLYDGGEIRTTGVQTGGSETNNPKFRGGILISQNNEVEGQEATLARIVHCHCTRDHFSPEGELAGDRLQAMEIAQLSGFLHHVRTIEKELLPVYFQRYKEVRKRFDEHRDLQNRLRQTHAQVAACAYLLPILFDGFLTIDHARSIEDFILTRAKDRQLRLGADHPIIHHFWETYEFINNRMTKGDATSYGLNHSKDPDLIAINLPHYRQMAMYYQQEAIADKDLKRFLKSSRRYTYKDQKPVKSQIENRNIYCWIFESGATSVNMSSARGGS